MYFLSTILHYSLLRKFVGISIFVFFINSIGWSQSGITITLKDAKTNETLPGVHTQILNDNSVLVSNSTGTVFIRNSYKSPLVVKFSIIGYKTLTDSLDISSNRSFEVKLEPTDVELETVFVTTTRRSRTIEEIPTRVEVISSSELEENATMNSANIAMLLQETTGIQLQQFSQSSGSAYIRIQGLDGRYTQLIRDGFPLYEGFSGGLSIMQIPPLDLSQVEVIKGSASTLYGGGAISGIINLVSKVPKEKPEFSVMLNQTTAKGTTVNSFYSRKNEKAGFTLYTALNNQFPYDANHDDFSDIPQIRSAALNPKFFYYFNDTTTLNFGINTNTEDRRGGDMQALKNSIDTNHIYVEKNRSLRISYQLDFEKKLKNDASFTFKNSAGFFNRDISIPFYDFNGKEISTFTEADYLFHKFHSDWIVGLNLISNDFSRLKPDTLSILPYRYFTVGSFIQNTFAFSGNITMESGLRYDYNTKYGGYVLPRISILFKISDDLSSRLGGGFGYKLPSEFTEETERLLFRNIQPLPNGKDLISEKSEGLNFDINYKKSFSEDVHLSLNQLFFYTRLHDYLLLLEDSARQQYYFVNSTIPIESKGFETNIRFVVSNFSLYVNYAYTNSRLKYMDSMMQIQNYRQKPLTPRHNLGMSLVYEQEKKWKIGYELYYTGHQYRSDNTETPSYWIMGFMVMRTINNVNLFLNFENFTDTRQSRFQKMVIPPFKNPRFEEIWAPIDGFVANAGFKISF